ncbi:PfkB family carbohydrate kinase [Arthrobacter sp. CAL618]|uniref:PfkB family carbohydrate kinase n=1 Tax=Arthrobacter sp. CAL618 TaxID=1055770 RepID=UPI000464F69C
MSVVIVGSINQDIVARVNRIPRPGETVLASTLVRTGGGKGANQAVAPAARAAHPSLSSAPSARTLTERCSERPSSQTILTSPACHRSTGPAVRH